MLPHTLITASAGSGKTWRLTVRYLRLVMMGAAPESIVALTFSRKAAGEFFNAILHRLAEAATDGKAAGALARDIQMPEKGVADFGQALERLTARLPFLMLGTLDSFFIRLARSFPFELGLSGEFTLLDEHQISVEKLRVYERVFAPEERHAEARAEFRRAFAEATFGKDEIRVRTLLDGFVKNWHSRFLTTPDPDKWGNPHRIWPGKSPLPGPQQDRAGIIQRIRTGLARGPWKENHLGRWDLFLEAAAVHLPGSPFSEPQQYLWKKLVPLLRDLETGSALLKMDRSIYDLEGPPADALTDLLRQLIAGELAAVLRQTRGIHEVVRRYDEAWHTLVRRRGRLTFDDVQLLLGGGLSPEASGHEARQSRLLTHRENRQLMDYRLDSRYEHWLLDEFQDTSRIQWRVLANLMDEAIQDSEGRKSFFAVGDQKQSIYEWRGGTPALFDELKKQYNREGLPPEQWPLKVEPIALSYRSGPAVIAMVNRLLGNKDLLLQSGLPPAAVALWDRQWQDHASKNTGYGGTALTIEVDPKGVEEDDAHPDIDPAWKRAAELIRDIRPLKRKLTCAVLCHQNRRALALTDYLRAVTGMPVVCESSLLIARDNPVTSALLALLQFAAHPGDGFAWQHLLMTPLAALMHSLPHEPDPPQHHLKTNLRRAVVRRVLEQLAETGFHDTLRWWAEALSQELQKQGIGLDAFSRGRLDELCGCAREFDGTGSRDTDEFLTFAGSWTERGVSHDAAIQVMTIHRSKGLTFDVVVIPDLGYAKIFSHRPTIGSETDACGEVEWLTKLPNKDIAGADPVLAGALERADAETWCERLCGLYVMVTRARYANYLFLPPPPKEARAASLHATARCTLTQPEAGSIKIRDTDYPLVAGFGDADWYMKHDIQPGLPPAARPSPITASPKPAVQPDLFGEAMPAAVETPRKKSIPLRPKLRAEDTGTGSNDAVFQSARAAAQESGTAIHAVFQRIGWLDDAEAALSGPGLDPVAVAEVRACLGTPALASLFTRPEGRAEVWRERAFDLLLDGVLESRVLDRVTVWRDAAGRPEQAVLVDFKTGPVNRSAAEAAGPHRPQLELYQRALSRLLGLPPAKIRAVVVLTSSREVVEL